MLARMGTGIFADAAGAVRRVAARPARTCLPLDKNVAIYDHAYRTFAALYPALKDAFRALRALAMTTWSPIIGADVSRPPWGHNDSGHPASMRLSLVERLAVGLR